MVECSTFHVNAPPDCSALVASPNPVAAEPQAPARDRHGRERSGRRRGDVTVTGVTQDEPVNGLGDGDTSPDAMPGPASNQVRLRAERSGTGDGRVYRIAVTVEDALGVTCAAR